MLQLLTDIPNSHARRDELHHRLEILKRPGRVQLLCLALDDPYPPLRHDVAEALQQDLDEDLTRFLEFIALGQAPPEELTEALQVPRELLPHDSHRARVTACVALEATPTPQQTLNVILQLVADQSADLRYQALIAMHHVDADSAALREAVSHALLNDPDSEIVVVASQIAIKNAWADMLPLLVKARERVYGEDRHQVTFSIGELIDASEATPDDLPEPVRREMIDEAVGVLNKEPLTSAAIRTLANLKAREVTDALEKVIDRWFAHPILKVDAAAALVGLDHPRGVDYIGRALDFRRKDARGYALRVVGKYRIERYFPRLVEVATSQAYHADTATLALADYGTPEARSILARIAETHPDAEVRELAAEGLHPQPDPDSFDATPGADGRVSK